MPAYVLLAILFQQFLIYVSRYVGMEPLVNFNVMMEMLETEMVAHLNVKLSLILDV